ncbi:Y-family DNA polymerase [Marinovum sp.]|uniref:Y-family DNA polymerase n=1 Tax=Marinovum sp. TaxID=2024839 RepID=UPI003A8D8384
MPRRLLSLWFPRLGAERLLRQARGEAALHEVPFAVVEDLGNSQVLSSVSALATAAGIYKGQPLRDAHAVSADLRTARRNRHAEAGFLEALLRWAGKFSPWVAEDGVDGLMLDVTGCTHLFGGEAPLCARILEETGDMGLTARIGLADSRGGAWALARYAGQSGGSARSGDDIDQEARATRSRAARRRHWERGGTAPAGRQARVETGSIAPPGQTRSALAALPVAALRLDPETTAQLARLGLRRIDELAGQPRAALARRFGKGLVLRLDQALGAVPEPLSPAAPPQRFAVRMTLPEPIGLEEDVAAGLDRLLPRLSELLRAKGQGARMLRLQAFRSDHTMQALEVRLARASDDPERLRPLLAMKLSDLDAGFGIDMLRLEAVQVEPLSQRTPVGHIGAGAAVNARLAANTALDDLIGRIGARVGMEAITRRHPGDSHIPEKTELVLAAAWSEPAAAWAPPARPRPLLLWRPEPVQAPDVPRPPARFRWRGRDLRLAAAQGPERIAPEWWLDDPDWRSGQRDYWRVTCEEGDALWLFYAHGAAMSSGWFCQGSFA